MSQTNNEREKLVNTDRAADHLSVKIQTLRGWVMMRKVPFRKTGSRLKFLLSELDRWAAEKGAVYRPSKQPQGRVPPV